MTWVTIVCLIITSLIPVQTWAERSFAKKAHDLVKKVDARYAHIQDLQADFSQETRIEGFETALRSSGHLRLKKPGLLRWDYVEPSVEHIYVVGDQVSVYVPEHKQVLKGNLTQMAASKAPLALLQGAGKLAQQFMVAPTPEGTAGDGHLPRVTLVPKDTEQQASNFERIVLEISPKTSLIQMMMLYEHSGNLSIIRFTHVKVNQGIQPKQLQLALPNDIVVVDAPIIQ